MCAADGLCPKESYQQSQHSPGIVSDDERLGRLVYIADWCDEDGNLKPAAFPIKDVLEEARGGWSFARLDHMSHQELQEIGDTLANKKPGRCFLGAGAGWTHAVRAICDIAGRRALCVIDAGERGFAAHATSHRSADQEDAELRKIRGLLIDLFSPVLTSGQLYPELLA